MLRRLTTSATPTHANRLLQGLHDAVQFLMTANRTGNWQAADQPPLAICGLSQEEQERFYNKEGKTEQAEYFILHKRTEYREQCIESGEEPIEFSETTNFRDGSISAEFLAQAFPRQRV